MEHFALKISPNKDQEIFSSNLKKVNEYEKNINF